MAEDGAIEMVLSSAGRVVARTSERFIGTTLDFWRADDPAYGEKWGNASALAVDLAPRLLALARGLSPGLLRIGGSPQDSIAYESIGGACPPLGERFDDLRRRKRRCAMLDHDPARCLASRWGKLRCWHREGRCRTVTWWAERYPTQPPQGGSGRTPRRLSTEAAAPSIAAAASEAAAPTSTVAASWASWLRERRVDYYCSQVHPAVYDCLTVARWRQLTTFAAAADLRLVFGLNACAGRTAANASLDFAPLERFLRQTAASQLPVWAFELGNELTGGYAGSDGVAPATLGADLRALGEALARAWPDANERPKLLAPDVAAFDFAPLPAYFEQTLRAAAGGDVARRHAEGAAGGRAADGGLADGRAAAGGVAGGGRPSAAAVLHAITFHQYPYCVLPDVSGGTVLSLRCLGQLTRAAASFAALAANWSIVAWAGEGANCWAGGVPRVTNAYVDLFYYALQLREMARHGVAAVVRQTLLGGDYALIDARLRPNPSYWLAVLWNRLVGPATLSLRVNGLNLAAADATAPARASLHCARGGGGVTAVIINYSVNRSVHVSLAAGLTPAAGGCRGRDRCRGGRVRLWLLTSSALSSRVVQLNGAALRPGPDGTLPALLPQRAQLPVHVQPASVAFLQWRARWRSPTCERAVTVVRGL